MNDRRDQIVRAATELVLDRGMSALSVRNVAAHAGIGASTLRHYFPTQRALYDAVVGQTFEVQLADLRIHDSSVPARHRLTECLAQFLPAHAGDRAELEQWLALYASAVSADRTGQARHLLAIFTTRTRSRVDTWLAVLAAEDALSHPDRRRHAAVLFAAVDGLALQLLEPEPLITVPEAHAILAEVVDQMVIATSADPAKGR